MNPLRFASTSNTAAFFVQAAISFTVSTTAVGVAIALLPAPAWVRAFLALGSLYIVTSTFTLAKCIRDRQEQNALMERFDRQVAGAAVPPAGPYADAGAWK